MAWTIQNMEQLRTILAFVEAQLDLKKARQNRDLAQRQDDGPNSFRNQVQLGADGGEGVVTERPTFCEICIWLDIGLFDWIWIISEAIMPGKILTEDPDRIDTYQYRHAHLMHTSKLSKTLQDNTCTILEDGSRGTPLFFHEQPQCWGDGPARWWHGTRRASSTCCDSLVYCSF